MKHIVIGTDRPLSNSKLIAQYISTLYKEMNEDVGIIDMAEIQKGIAHGPQYGDPQNPVLKNALDTVLASDGLIIVVPEYNGSMPGILKYFIDHLKFPESFEFRPVCFVGLGGMFGGLRPVEHLQQVFGYRNAFIYPERIFMINVWKQLKDGVPQDQLIVKLLKQQAHGFTQFVNALKESKLHSNTRIKT